MYLMKYKHESFERSKEFKAQVEKQTRKYIKALWWWNHAGEYMCVEFAEFHKEHGIVS